MQSDNLMEAGAAGDPVASANILPTEAGSSLSAFFEASPIGFAIFDDLLRCKAVNRALAALTGIPARDHAGRTPREILGDSAGEIEATLRQVLSTGQPLCNVKVVLSLPMQSSPRHWAGSYFPIEDLKGNVRQVGAAMVEITEGERREQEGLHSNPSQREAGDHLHALLELRTRLASPGELREKFPDISRLIRKVVKQDQSSMLLLDDYSQALRPYASDGFTSNPMTDSDILINDPAELGRALQDQETRILEFDDFANSRSEYIRQMRDAGFQSLCMIPVSSSRGRGMLTLASRQQGAFTAADAVFLQLAAAQLAAALDNDRAREESAALTVERRGETGHCAEEAQPSDTFAEIVGESAVLKQVLSQVRIVAPSDATVLILGETGTGKELIARAIHRLSSRKGAPIAKLNCAAIPTGLLESELFGHEKGAFTGAISQKIGRLELADGGTLFLDEVGDIPIELQPKLLRVLQDHEFERLGGLRTIRVNVRLIAATNLDLAERVAEREFRSDLYYRLHVFPLRTPPLRDRRTDIPLLVRHFVRQFSRRLNKQIESIPADAMQALIHWDWPGNIRELENFIERSVILTAGRTLSPPLAELASRTPSQLAAATLEGVEREHIVRMLREAGGVIAGANGAANRLGMKRTTLQSRMQKLKINRREFEN